MSSPFNVWRKMFHFSGIVVVIIYYFELLETFPSKLFRENTRSILFYLIITTFFIMILVEILRFSFPTIQKYFLNIAGKLIKPEEAEKTHGSLPFFLGMAICVAFYSKETVIISFLYLMVGDPSAAWFGGKYGKHKFKNHKSIEGLVAGIIAAFGAGLAFIVVDMIFNPEGPYALRFLEHPVSGVFILLCGAITGFVFELISTRGLFDDNLLIPVMSGLVISLLSILLYDIQPQFVFYSLRDLMIPR